MIDLAEFKKQTIGTQFQVRTQAWLNRAADFLLLRVYAVENRKDNSVSETEFAGHYADSIQFNIPCPPATNRCRAQPSKAHCAYESPAIPHHYCFGHAVVGR